MLLLVTHLLDDGAQTHQLDICYKVLGEEASTLYTAFFCRSGCSENIRVCKSVTGKRRERE